MVVLVVDDVASQLFCTVRDCLNGDVNGGFEIENHYIVMLPCYDDDGSRGQLYKISLSKS